MSRAPAAWQPRQPVFWVLATGILVCAPLQVRDLMQQEPAGVVLTVSLLVAAAELVAFWIVARVLGARVLGGRHPEPTSLRIAALAWGLTVVPVIAAFANTLHFRVLNGLGLHAFAAAIAAPVDEDLLRFIGVLGVLGLAAPRGLTVRGGLVLGFLVGSGFEVSENLAFLFSSTDLAGTLQLALVRLGIGFGLHALWTGIAGASLAYVLGRRSAGLAPRWGVAVLGLLLPMLLHALWDAPSPSISPPVVYSILGAVYLLTLTAFVGWAVASRERRRR